MPSQSELAREAEWFEQILGLGAKLKPLAPGGKVCQACGEIGYFATIDEHTAGHSEQGGDFLALSKGHDGCACALSGYELRRRPWRFCEICRGTVDALADTRRGLAWACRECEARAVTLGEPLGPVLRELASRRFEAPVEPSPAAKPERAALESDVDGSEIRIPPLRGWLPRGLEICASCGAVTGETWRQSDTSRKKLWRADSRCFCEGRVCESCGRRRLRRPISNYFDPEEGHWWHCAWYMGYQRKCRDCRAADEASAADQGAAT